MTEERVLFVDDDPNILASFTRQLHRQYRIVTAESGAVGLETVEREGPFAVIVSDMRMPGMDGAEFLSRVKTIAPDSVRIMLTGNADLQTAVMAVNRGEIFRFLNKPCSRETLSAAVDAGIRQYRLVTAEKELLEQTLGGSIRLLSDLLGLVNPLSFSRASRIRRYATHIAQGLGLRDLWQYRVAAALSHVGCVTIPSDVLDKVYAGQSLTDEERAMYEGHPRVGAKLLQNIPRLEPVARMIEGQRMSWNGGAKGTDLSEEDPVRVGSCLLRVAIDFERLVSAGKSREEAIAEMRIRAEEYHPGMLSALQNLPHGEERWVQRKIGVRELVAQMILDEDVRSRNGMLLVPKGQEVTYPVLERLRNFAAGVGVAEPFRVLLRVEESA
ncbi:MAG: response regulator [Deltaproteobacteria bacterium]